MGIYKQKVNEIERIFYNKINNLKLDRDNTSNEKQKELLTNKISEFEDLEYQLKEFKKMDNYLNSNDQAQTTYYFIEKLNDLINKSKYLGQHRRKISALAKKTGSITTLENMRDIAIEILNSCSETPYKAPKSRR